MNISYKEIIPEDFHPASRVWIYQSNRLFTVAEALQVEEILENFIKGWQSHGTPVKGYANVLYGQFVIIIADETVAGVSGCSTDSSVRVMKQLEEEFKVNMFDRQLLAFLVKDKIQMLPLAQLKYAVENGFINGDTMYFNNLVATKQELLEKWLIPAKESWLAGRLKFTQPV
ncbi:MAG TPA: hypothetical protein PLA68_10875 [Panacibacter sp.]|nr:hypothetical protein [Panacibacter sp.]